LFILPGGIAEVFTSTPGKHKIVFKKRRGLIKLAIECGAQIVPSYVFGATDFYHNLATTDSWLAKLSRKMRIGVAMFIGQYGLPIPFAPRVTMCFGDPLQVRCWTGEGPIPDELVETLHREYIEGIREVFERYKAAAGYPDAKLEIQ
jgi:diacylglycerol O-acyltransferase 2, plant